MKITRYHKFLRTALVVTAGVLVFDGGFVFPITKQLSDVSVQYVASVGAGMHASVPPNEYNSLSAQLAEQQRNLDAREAALSEREISTRSFDTSGDSDFSTYVLSIILFILTVLIVFNYVMDFAHLRHLRYLEQAIPR